MPGQSSPAGLTLRDLLVRRLAADTGVGSLPDGFVHVLDVAGLALLAASQQP